MAQTFFKYQGTGNDFIMIDDRQEEFDRSNTKLIEFLCDRRFGVGADGLILLAPHSKYDFKMVYFNSDGNESSMCGNGGRCIASFAKFLGIIDNETTFEAIDGTHKAVIENGLVSLLMQDVNTIEKHEHHILLDTGSPHHVQLENALKDLDVQSEGAKIRYGQPYGQEGVNINFVKKLTDDTFAIRTYERGVEGETLSCGTGVTAVALAMNYSGETEKNVVQLETEGGRLEVAFEKSDTGYTNIWLKGPAVQVYKGDIEW